MFNNKIDEYLNANAAASRKEERQIFLYYQLKYSRLLESILLQWNIIKYLNNKEFEKKKTLCFFEILKKAKEEDDNPISIFNRLPINKQIELYNNFI